MSKKFSFCCWDCGSQVKWKGFSSRTRCEKCKSNIFKVTYPEMSWGKLIGMFHEKGPLSEGLWRYYDFLPLSSRANIVTSGEGNIPIDRWEFLEQFARKQGHIDCRVFAHRHDSHPSTGSFKDLAASLVASALKEHGVKEYVVASTGNIGVAFARYLAASDCTLYAFIPQDSPPFKEAEIACFGQNVFRVMGDYATAQEMAANFAAERGIPLAGGTFDPFRIEAKKTMAFEWYRRMERFPDVYIQALSGGTGPLGVYKGSQELLSAKLVNKMPRMLLVQSEKCAPMARAWAKAKKGGFPQGWNLSYEIINEPQTQIPTLATGDPMAYPRLARIVHEVDGEIFSFPEHLAPDIARVIAFEVGVRIGPAGAVGVGGFFEAVKRQLIYDGDIVVIAVGEGIRRDPDFMVRLMPKTQPVKEVSECKGANRALRADKVWAPLIDYVNSR